jgi:hypothetical protein
MSPSPQNSIRHNLSLHNKFIRVQNEGTGKSSWWMINAEAKSGGKSSRRRSSNPDNGEPAPFSASSYHTSCEEDPNTRLEIASIKAE